MKRLAKHYEQEVKSLNIPSLNWKIIDLQDDVDTFYKKAQKVCDYINDVAFESEILEQAKKVKELSLNYKREVNSILDETRDKIKESEKELGNALEELCYLVED